MLVLKFYQSVQKSKLNILVDLAIIIAGNCASFMLNCVKKFVEEGP